MKFRTFFCLSISAVALSSCTNNPFNKKTGNPYGAPAASSATANPYAVPQVNGEAAPYQSIPGVAQPAHLPDIPPAVGAPDLAPSPSGLATSHTVVAGDSLWALARSYNTTVAAIQAANGISGTNIRVGQTLQIPAN